VRVHRAAEHALELEFAHIGLERIGLAFDLARGGLVVLGLRQRQQLRRVLQRDAGAFEILELDRQACAFPAKFLGAFRDCPDGRILEFPADFLQTFLFAIVFKGTPSRRRRVPRDL
jgi:hypothetical protein